MAKTKTQKVNIEKLSKLNSTIIFSCFSCVFVYFVFLGLTATNVVTTKSLTKTVDEKKTELATVELDYMNTENIVALESISGVDFGSAKNISYVKAGDTDNPNLVALGKKDN